MQYVEDAGVSQRQSNAKFFNSLTGFNPALL
jgi:hypothetical protein